MRRKELRKCCNSRFLSQESALDSLESECQSICQLPKSSRVSLTVWTRGRQLNFLRIVTYGITHGYKGEIAESKADEQSSEGSDECIPHPRVRVF